MVNVLYGQISSTLCSIFHVKMLPSRQLTLPQSSNCYLLCWTKIELPTWNISWSFWGQAVNPASPLTSGTLFCSSTVKWMLTWAITKKMVHVSSYHIWLKCCKGITLSTWQNSLILFCLFLKRAITVWRLCRVAKCRRSQEKIKEARFNFDAFWRSALPYCLSMHTAVMTLHHLVFKVILCLYSLSLYFINPRLVLTLISEVFTS